MDLFDSSSAPNASPQTTQALQAPSCEKASDKQAIKTSKPMKKARDVPKLTSKPIHKEHKVRFLPSKPNIFHKNKSLTKFQKLQSEGDFQCEYCGRQFNKTQSLGGHISKKHPGRSEAYAMK